MKYYENARRELDTRAKVVILATLCIAFAVAFIPLWQVGTAASLRVETARAQERLDDLDREDRALRASISDVDRSNMKYEVTQILAGI